MPQAGGTGRDVRRRVAYISEAARCTAPHTELQAMLARLLSRARPAGLLRVPRVPPTLVARAMSSGGILGDAPSLAAAAEDEAPERSGDVLWQVRGIESHLPEPMWQALSRVNMSQAELNQLEVHEKIKRWQRFEGDTGSAEVSGAQLGVA